MLVSQVVGPGRSEVVEVEDLVPGARQVLLEVLACGVCTSDRTAWGEHDVAGAPTRLGHEVVGRVSGVGVEAARWRIGDVVTGLGGDGFATAAVFDADSLAPIPTGIAPELALGEPLAVLEEAISRAGIRPGDRVAIVGLGFMGLGLVQLAALRLPSLLVGIDPRPGNDALALRLGAHEVHRPDALPTEFTTGGLRELRFDVVIEAAGVTSALSTSSTIVRPYGTVCVVGYHHSGTAPMDMELWYKGVTTVNGFSPHRPRTMRAMRDGLGMIADRTFDYTPLITHRFGLREVDAAFELMREHPASFVKSVIVP
ncbi:alcohol dehydrogenase catalytic domain-containing protein [Microbacterium sp. NPDC058389]|uniref:alcohol dehydrogenase catalytic domain-containing protein n=1 Tax=Microbacterium sp. NPDC058389 TaxID=3346475 RepID=UPI003667141E